MNVAEIVIAASLVVLVLVFVRISWTLKEINDTLASRGNEAGPAARGMAAGGTGSNGAVSDAARTDSVLDENELAAVIAVAYNAYREAV